MLMTSNVREQEPPHVRHRGHPRPLVLSVISPHESHELLHEIVELYEIAAYTEDIEQLKELINIRSFNEILLCIYSKLYAISTKF